MKRNTYIAIITVVTVACIIGGTAYRTMKWGRNVAERVTLELADIENKASSKEKEAVKGEQEGKFDSIQANLSVMDFHVIQGDDYHVNYQCDKDLKPEIKLENGVLTVTQRGDSHVHWFGVSYNRECEIYITVPEEAVLQELVVDSDVGDVEIDGIKAKAFNITTDVGDMTIENCDMGNAQLYSDVGDTDALNVTFENLEAEGSVGDIEIEAAQSLTDYTMDLSTDVGTVEVNDRDQGDEYYVDGDSGKKIIISAATGDVEISGR